MATSAPLFFFTDLDESRRPKGSRDPLGLEPIWSQAGRRLVGNLTTVTRSLDNFVVALVGFAVSANDAVPGSARFALRFERFEQLAAWARFVEKMPGVIGSRIIAERDATRILGDQMVEVGAGPAARILGDQRRSGLWGLYSSALMGTGLIDAKRALTSAGTKTAAEFLEYYERAPGMKRFRQAMASVERISRVSPEALGFKELLELPARNKLAECLLVDGQGIFQKTMFQLACSGKFANVRYPFQLFDVLAHDTPSSNQSLSQYARDVIVLERMLVVVNAAFDFLLGPTPRPMAKLVERFIEQGWLNDDEQKLVNPLRPEFVASFPETWKHRCRGLSEAIELLNQRNIGKFIEKILGYHGEVMKDRGGPAWVSMDASKSIRGIMGETVGLPQRESLFKAWNNDYFVGAFSDLAAELNVKSDTQLEGVAQ
ncbi:hypothetical protein [Caballeronia sp. 15711]|uniref:hypothetical protein n=1 Tax=Caballeronia sp. 15711 TaxID=3391029 RepID=UPI0039E43BA3